MNDQRWITKHSDYSKQDWITKPSIFAEQVIEYFPKNGCILELGAGHGQDGIYFASHGFKVVSTDLETTSLNKNIVDTKYNISAQTLDLRQPFYLSDESFDIVYAHLALHYFDQETTERIFADTYRVLKPDGILAFLVNSVGDPEYKTGKRIEKDFFEIDGVQKRFFNVENAKTYAHQFKMLVADNHGETYKDSAKGVHNLIRFVGRKKLA